jgi:hypothetical protein
MVFGRYLSRICLSLSIAIAFAKRVGHVRSHPRNSIATAGRSHGFRRRRDAQERTGHAHFPPVGVRRFSRAMVSLAVRPSSSAGAEPTWLDVLRNAGRRAMRVDVYTV